MDPKDTSQTTEDIESGINRAIERVPKQYSPQFVEFVRLLLAVDPQNRPGAEEAQGMLRQSCTDSTVSASARVLLQSVREARWLQASTTKGLHFVGKGTRSPQALVCAMELQQAGNMDSATIEAVAVLWGMVLRNEPASQEGQELMQHKPLIIKKAAVLR